MLESYGHRAFIYHSCQQTAQRTKKIVYRKLTVVGPHYALHPVRTSVRLSRAHRLLQNK